MIWLSPLNQVTCGTGTPRTSQGIRMVDCGENSVLLRRTTTRTGTGRAGSVRQGTDGTMDWTPILSTLCVNEPIGYQKIT